MLPSIIFATTTEKIEAAGTPNFRVILSAASSSATMWRGPPWNDEIAIRASAYDTVRYGVNLYNLACANARSGDVRMALDSLRKAVESGFSDKALILRDTDLDTIRDRPEFQEILANIR